jgi:serine/threonine protein kinase
MVAVKRIGLEGLKEEEISQLMREVDLVKRLSHPSIVKYEGMARDENALSIVLECVVLPTPFYAAQCFSLW